MTSPGFEYAIVDAFCGAALQGNPAAVVGLAHPRSRTWMQGAARKTSQPATAFVDRSATPFGLRWFTPVTELPLCGHGTLAAGCFVLEDSGEDGVRFDTRGGTVGVSRTGLGFELDFPLRRYSVAVSDPISRWLGVAPVAVGVCGDDWLVELATVDDVVACAPHQAGLASVARSVVITARGGQGADITSRVFAPAIGIPEDQVTGSAHCGLATWWGSRLGRTFTALQASPRGGLVRIRRLDDRVVLGGAARIRARRRLES